MTTHTSKCEMEEFRTKSFLIWKYNSAEKLLLGWFAPSGMMEGNSA